MRDTFLSLTFSTMLLAIALLIWAVFELQHQRDFWKERYCYEIAITDPDHPVCEE